MIRPQLTKYLFLLSTLVTLTVFSQTSDITTGCAPMTVQFFAPGSASSYYWDFMDGASSNLQNPSNTFTTPGTYVVEFSQSTTGPVLGTVTIIVFQKPDPEIITTSALQGCTPLTVSLQGSAATPPGIVVTSYVWAFGQGSGGSGQNVSFTYSTPGVYDVSLEVTTNFPTCNNTGIFNDYISVSNPTANFSTNPNPAFSCTAPLNVAFNNTSVSTIPLTYTWDMGNSNTYTTVNPPAQDYTSTGLFPVTLTITDTNGCVKTITKNVSIGSPVAGFTAQDSVCINTEVTLTSTSSPGVHLWTFGPGATPATSTLFNPDVTFTTPGIHNVQLTITSPNGQCSNDTTIAIFVEDPSFTIHSEPGYACQSPVTFDYSVTTTANVDTWSWTFGDDSTSALPNPSHIYELWDTTYNRRGVEYLTTSLEIVTTTGCSFTASIVDTIYPVFARFMPDIVYGCGPLTVTFSDSSLSNEPLVSWNYDYGDGTNQTLTSDAPHSHIFSGPGVYNVVLTATNNAGCFDISDTIQIQVGEPVTLDFSASPLSVCPGDSISFTNLMLNPNVDAWHFSSDGEQLSHCFGEDEPTFAFDDTTGLFDITFTAIYNGCISSVTKADYIEVKGPIAKFNYLYDCSAPLDVQFTDQSMGASAISWDLGDGTTETAGSFTHSYAVSGSYQVIVTATNATSGCPDSRDTFLLPVKTIQALFNVDDTYCGNSDYAFDASASVDVYSDCYRGYSWIFDDPSLRPFTTEDAIATLNFPTTGMQNLTLVVRDENGCTDSLTKTISVYNLNAVFAMDVSTICLPGSVNFNESSTSDTTLVDWTWDFGDNTGATIQDPAHTYPTGSATGPIPVKLVVTDILGCKDSATVLLPVYTPFSAIVSPGAMANYCAGALVNFSATDFTSMGSNLNFSWDFDDGTNAVTNPVTHTFNTGGTYEVTLHFQEVASGCQDSTTKIINVQSYPEADFSGVDPGTALCNPAVVNFTNTSVSGSPTSAQWTFTPGQSTTIPSPTFTFTTGSYTAALITTTSFGCSDTVIKQFNVLGPQGDFIYDGGTICRGDEIIFTITDTADVVSYEWSFGDGLSDTDISPVTHQYNFIPPSGQTIAKLTIFGDTAGACPVTIEKPVFIHEVRALFDRNDELDTMLCLGEVLSITDNSTNATAYSWEFGDGNTSVQSGSFNYTYTQTDTFAIQLAVFNATLGCRDTLTKQVIVHPLPVVTATGDTVCAGDQGQLHAFSPDQTMQWSWTPADGLSNAFTAAPFSTVNETTTYTVTGFNTVTQCSSSADAVFDVIQPLSDIDWDTTIVIGDIINLPISNQNGFVIFTWNPETGLSCTDCSNPAVQPLVNSTYTVILQDILGCSTAEGIFVVNLHPETFIDLPTTFTPNGDGVNDIIYVKGWGIKDLIYFQVFNRWGELVFESTEEEVGWDGYYKGMLQNNGSYTYKVKAVTWRNEEQEKNGYINLMR